MRHLVNALALARANVELTRLAALQVCLRRGSSADQIVAACAAYDDAIRLRDELEERAKDASAIVAWGVAA